VRVPVVGGTQGSDRDRGPRQGRVPAAGTGGGRRGPRTRGRLAVGEPAAHGAAVPHPERHRRYRRRRPGAEAGRSRQEDRHDDGLTRRPVRRRCQAPPSLAANQTATNTREATSRGSRIWSPDWPTSTSSRSWATTTVAPGSTPAAWSWRSTPASVCTLSQIRL